MKFTMPWTTANGHAKGTTDKIASARQALGGEVDHLAHLAAHIGRDAGSHVEDVAHNVARDAQKQSSVVVNRIADVAATLGPTIATIGRRKVRQATEQAQSLGQELRQVRITTAPRRNAALPGIALLGGLGIGVGTGIAMMYLLDPDHGKRRRQMLVGRLARLTRAGREAVAQKANASANRTVGVMADVRESVTTGIGVDADAPLIADELAYEAWPGGTRVPVG